MRATPRNVPEMAPDEYDNVYIVSIPWFGKVKTLRVRYGLRADFGGIYTELKESAEETAAETAEPAEAL